MQGLAWSSKEKKGHCQSPVRAGLVEGSYGTGTVTQEEHRHCLSGGKQGRSRGNKYLSLSFLLTSVLVLLPPIGQTQPEAREKGTQVRQSTEQGREGQRLEDG